ncbi:MAG: hypothetical protein QNJ30_09935 [Kiloniellales bacterium]|nr:hypothetical protein [Kiloniellales bacterium]
MRWFSSWRRRRAAKRYAQCLGPCLLRHFGNSQTYTRAQIQRCVTKAGLTPRYIALGYASFLEESDFEALVPGLPIRIGYEEARALVARYRPYRGEYVPQTAMNAHAGQKTYLD